MDFKTNTMTYYSQAGQDKWVMDLIPQPGFFVDIGAYDGVQTSNTYALELSGWEGICVEAEIGAYSRMKEIRKCKVVNLAVTNYFGMCGFEGDRITGIELNTLGDMPCDTLQGILRSNGARNIIDYGSFDIEGHEFTVLEKFPFNEFTFKLITIEHNLYCDGPAKKDALFALLSKNGYVRVVDNAPCLDPNPAWHMQPYEDWYRHESFKI